mmetsp:Transcript_24528/g.39595  ORF Transcript_24528/g.39595 Transcript_24528/m.39595 type:complete len:123 (-) Transcript_24528:64-432(-)
MLPRWNVVYDLDDGTGFYTDSGLSAYCKGKLNRHWFAFNKLSDEEAEQHYQHDEVVFADHSTQWLRSPLSSTRIVWVWLMSALMVAVIFGYYVCLWSKGENMFDRITSNKWSSLHSTNYGSV